jgi:hypothetical protein
MAIQAAPGTKGPHIQRAGLPRGDLGADAAVLFARAELCH